MIDGGQGFLKLSLSILPPNYNPITDSASKDSEDSDKDAINTDMKGNNFPFMQIKLTGVRKLVILAIVPDIPETNSNLEILFEKTGINDISFKLAADFKMLYVCLGLQNSVAIYPCPYCEITLNDLRDLEKSVFEKNFEIPKERTFGTLKKDYNKFQSEFFSKKKDARYCHSTINQCVIQEGENISILEKCPMDELHIMEGIVNHIFFKGLVIKIGRENAMKWPKKINVVPVLYQGEKFEGNGCRALIKSSHILQDKEIMGIQPLIVQPFVATFQALDKLVVACFDSQPVTGDITSLLRCFSKAYLALEISTTVKVHVLITHLIPCLMNLGGQGLGVYSTQAGESIHKYFEKNFWAKYKVNSLSHPEYGKRLLNATIEFSSKNI